MKTIDHVRDDDDDYEIRSGLKPGAESAYTSNKSRRGNMTDRKSMKPSQSVLNMLVKKDKLLADA